MIHTNIETTDMIAFDRIFSVGDEVSRCVYRTAEGEKTFLVKNNILRLNGKLPSIRKGIPKEGTVERYVYDSLRRNTFFTDEERLEWFKRHP